MAHFYGGTQGGAGLATRIGSKSSGYSGFVKGWDLKVITDAVYVDGDDRNVYYITIRGAEGQCIDDKELRCYLDTETNQIVMQEL